VTLGFFPPQPSEGPLSILDLPPDDWTIQAKLDGCRVVISGGKVFTRQGTLLGKPKGAGRIPTKFPQTVEGEWVLKTGILSLFDLPDSPLPYEGRWAELVALIKRFDCPIVRAVPHADAGFRAFYEHWKGRAEGVVVKRRASLYQKCGRPGFCVRDWLKRRYSFDGLTD
jgi:ATP-dependent DNA ligase